MEFTISILASLIFIIGFSINDTIVTLDRIRENVKLNPKQKLGDIINLSYQSNAQQNDLNLADRFLHSSGLVYFRRSGHP